MPIYEYRCESCGHQEDHLQKVSEKPLAVCPACGKRAYKKMLSAAGFQLKGSGWYATDFKTAGKKPAEKTTEAKAEAKGDAKTDTKSESKKDSGNSKADSKPKAAATG
jgi:putative FmdB family regulatory protein